MELYLLEFEFSHSEQLSEALEHAPGAVFRGAIREQMFRDTAYRHQARRQDIRGDKCTRALNSNSSLIQTHLTQKRMLRVEMGKGS
jgi:hypothetical protein